MRSRPDQGSIQVDRQQAVLLDRLRRARGQPVSYAELRDAGIEFPASVVSELELAGIELERSYNGRDSEARAVGVRLARPDAAELPPTIEPVAATADGPPDAASRLPDSIHVYRTSSTRLLMELFIGLIWRLPEAVSKLLRGGRAVFPAIAGRIHRPRHSAEGRFASAAGQAATRLRRSQPVAAAVALFLAMASLATGLVVGLLGSSPRHQARLSAAVASRSPARSAKLPPSNVSEVWSGVAAHVPPPAAQPAPASQPATGSSDQVLASQAPPAPRPAQPSPRVKARTGRAASPSHASPRPTTKRTTSPPRHRPGHPPRPSGPPRHRPRPSGGAAPRGRAG